MIRTPDWLSMKPSWSGKRGSVAQVIQCAEGTIELLRSPSRFELKVRRVFETRRALWRVLDHAVICAHRLHIDCKFMDGFVVLHFAR